MWRYVSTSLMPVTGLFFSKKIMTWRFTIFMLIVSGFASPKVVLTGALDSFDISRYLNSYDVIYRSNANSFSDVVVLDFVNRKQAIELVPALLTWIGLSLGFDATCFFYLIAFYFSFALGSLLFYSKQRFGWLFCVSLFFLIPYYGVNGYRFWSGLALIIAGVISDKKYYLILGMFTHLFFFPVTVIILILKLSKKFQVGAILLLFLLVSINVSEIFLYIDEFVISSIDSYYMEIQEKSGGSYLRYFKFTTVLLLLIWSFRAIFCSKYKALIILTGTLTLFLWNVPGLGRIMYLIIPFCLLDNNVKMSKSSLVPFLISSIISFMITSYVMRDAVEFPLFII